MSRVIVHGVHRSGTSLTASLLERAGFWYAEDDFRMLSQEDNPKGFWERTDVVDLNDAILAEAQLNWFTLAPRLSPEAIPLLSEKFGQRISEVVRRLDQYDNWFLKDPRFALTWPLWAPFVESPIHLVVHRHPVSVAKSLHARDGITIKHGLMFWYQQTKMIAENVLDQEDVFNFEFRSGRHIDLIDLVIEIANKYRSNSTLSQADFDDIYVPSLVHQTKTDESVINEFDSVAKAWGFSQRENFSALVSLPELQLAELTWKDVDSRDALSVASLKYEREISQFRHDVVEKQEKIVEQRQKIVEQREKLAEQREKLAEQREKLTEQKSELAELNERFNTLLEKSNSQQNEIEQRGEEVIELNRRLLAISGELKSYMLSKRYLFGYVIGKVFSRLKLIKPRSLHDGFDIAKYGHSTESLAHVLPRPSNRYLLIEALIKNPMSFIKRFSISRLLKGIQMLFGRAEGDLGVQHALLQYSPIDWPADESVDIFDAKQSDAWSKMQLEFEAVESPKVSIVIPVYNNFLTTLACLQSIKKHTDPSEVSYEVIIADDFSDDETDQLSDCVKGIRIIRGESNVGFLLNCNHAIPKASGEFIVLLNNDTNVQRGWLLALTDTLENDSSIGIVGPKFIYPDGRLQEAGGIIFSDGSGWNYGRLDQPDKPEYNFARDVDYISGACLMFRQTLWKEIGGFDELFLPAYYEDTDFCFTARKLGFRIRYVPTSLVVHFEGVSHGTSEHSGIKKHQATNCTKFAEKWKQVLECEHYSGPEYLFLARKHGKQSKVLLYIDHYVPFYDKDAGSKVAQRYIELLVEQGVHVIFLGDNFYPHQPYTSQLQVLGVEVLYGEFYKNNWYEWLEENSARIDTVYLNRPHISTKYIDKIRALQNVPRLAYHGADLHYIRTAREESLGISKSDLSSKEWKEVEFELMRKCDVSLWLSQNEVGLVKSEDESINVAYKPMYWFSNSDLDIERKVTKELNILFVGSFGHPPNRDGLELFLDETFPKIIARFPNVLLTIIGSNCPDDIKALQSENINVMGFVTEDELVKAYLMARVSIVPLRYGAGVKGKVIESLEHGVPVLTTSIGAEGLPGKTDSYLSIAYNETDFFDCLVKLLEQDELCLQYINNADLALLKYFSKDTALVALREILGCTSSEPCGQIDL